MQTLVDYGTFFKHKPSLNYLCFTKNNSSNYCSKIGVLGNNNKHIYNNDEKYLEVDLKKELIPKHVAIILDGSRRWLKAQGKPLNYDPFFQANTLFADLCLKWGVSTATTFIYSFKNLQRGQEANDLLFGQLEKYLESNLQNFVRYCIDLPLWAYGSTL
ncbi:dehydrodolichyl diphosphate synthase 4-like [Chenopodium quinoa]|uniref:dehydrodolichyl diphosphate synthase 4-like n=1 Tax=Chenopodium quinoa TaxID=63459 RepID=UPI000B76BBE5|nr:dehydrodolichyl diphosphate synthase 4-like [Chenopodium quinoa]